MTRAEDLARTMHLRYGAPTPIEPREGELDPTSLLRILRRRFWLMAGVTLLLTLAALPSILSRAPSYVAASRVLIQAPSAAVLAGPERSRLPLLNLHTEVERLLSRDVAAQVIGHLRLDAKAEFNPALEPVSAVARLKTALFGAVGALVRGGASQADGTVAGRDPLDPVIRSFFEALQVSRDPSSEVIEIAFTSRDPSLAAAVPNTLLHVYLDARQSDQARRMAAADRWLADRMEEQGVRLAQAERVLEDFSATGGLASSELLAGSVKTIADLGARRAEIERTRGQLTATSAALRQSLPPEDRIAMVNTTAAADLARRLPLQRRELARLLDVYGGASPQVVAAQDKLQDTSAAIEIEIARYAETLDARLASMDQDEALTQAGLATAGAAVQNQAVAGVRRRELEKAVATQKEALTALEEQRRVLASESRLPSADVEVLSPATPPLYPTGRGRLFLLAVALVCAGLAGVTVATLAEVLDRSVRSPSQLGGIDTVPAGMLQRLPARVVEDLPGILVSRRDGALADAIRGVIAGLRRTDGGRFPGSVLVTSPLPGEGKSVLSLALAVELSATRPVLLVDCDTRRGRVHTMLGGVATPGLGEVIDGRSQIADAVQIEATSGLAYLSRGSSCGRPLDAATLAAILAYAKEQERIVIFDTPPALATLTPTVIAEMAEVSLLVLKWGETQRSCAEAAIERLRSAGARPIALVVTMVDPRRHALYGFKDPIAWSARLSASAHRA